MAAPDALVRARGFRVLRFGNAEVMRGMNTVLDTIHAALAPARSAAGGTPRGIFDPPPPPRRREGFARRARCPTPTTSSSSAPGPAATSRRSARRSSGSRRRWSTASTWAASA
ncbi:DUF559 domain-containing protein [Methylobacterium nigriterrae]|uniref:DUF559 domain-containing protein n=1 Tax=Methylobacterium nigriterrae TaxID=3127512 RepID=UPI003D66C4CC